MRLTTDEQKNTLFLSLLPLQIQTYFVDLAAKDPTFTFEREMSTFITLYGNPEKKSTASRKLREYRQQDNSILKYIQEFTHLALYAGASLESEYIKETFFHGLEPKLKQQFQMEYKTESKRSALSWEEITSSLKEISHVLNPSSKLTGFGKSDKSEKQSDRYKPYQGGHGKGNGKDQQKKGKRQRKKKRQGKRKGQQQ